MLNIFLGCVYNTSVVLEPVVAEAEPALVAEAQEPPENVTDTPPPEEATPPEQEQTAAEPTTPAPKKRGRPRKDPATPAKAVAPKPRAKPVAKRADTTPVPAPPLSSSDEKEPMSQADLETEILNYLVQRKTHQQDRRRQLWSQLAGLG